MSSGFNGLKIKCPTLWMNRAKRLTETETSHQFVWLPLNGSRNLNTLIVNVGWGPTASTTDLFVNKFLACSVYHLVPLMQSESDNFDNISGINQLVYISSSDKKSKTFFDVYSSNLAQVMFIKNNNLFYNQWTISLVDSNAGDTLCHTCQNTRCSLSNLFKPKL